MSGQSAELVFRGGTVITVDRRFSLAAAAAVRAGRILAVGPEREIDGLIGAHTRVVELAGGALLPGINESHLHAALLGAGASPGGAAGPQGGAIKQPGRSRWGQSPPHPGATVRTLRTEAERRAALGRAWDALLRLGVTSYTEPGLGPGAEHQHGGACAGSMLATYQRLQAERALPLRVNVLALYGEIGGPPDPLMFMDAVAALRPTASEPDQRLRLAGVTIFADGAPAARTAWMNEPYVGGGNGKPLIPGGDDAARIELLDGMVAAAHAGGLQVGVHATGSRAIDAAVKAFARAASWQGAGSRQEAKGARDTGSRPAAASPRHYVIGGDCASPAALGALARGDFGLNAQPVDRRAATALLAAALGPVRARRALPRRGALRAGVRLCLSSAGPGLAPDWRRGVAAAVAGASAPDFEAALYDEHVELQDALRAYTIVPAWQDHAERFKGSIEVGKVADLCVLARNPLAIAPSELPDVAVTMTVVDGEVVYEA